MARILLLSFVVATSLAAGCGGDDSRTEASQYALDPIACAQDSDCCVVNDGCRSTAYVVAFKDSTTVSSLIASADNSTCNKCVSPMLQVSCGPSLTCVAERIDFRCSLPMPYPGNHCGKIDLPASCLTSTSMGDAGTQPSDSGTLKPLAVFGCGG
jgi:hypothetical protein